MPEFRDQDLGTEAHFERGRPPVRHIEEVPSHDARLQSVHFSGAQRLRGVLV